MSVQHSALTGSSLHEPKGVATATSGQVYVADGSGSGAWTSQTIPTGETSVTQSIFTSSGTWTKPSNCYLVKIYAMGGGGGGTSSGSANNGGDTTFGTYLTAHGGKGADTGGGGAAGSGSSGSVNDYVINGNAGVDGTEGVSAQSNGPYGSSADSRNKYGQGGAGNSGAGGSGQYVEGWRSADDLTSSVTVTIGNGGNNDGGSSSPGIKGFMKIEAYNKVTS
jgi:hypothetical protein